MAILTVIFLFVVIVAWKDGRPLKLILTDDESRAVKARWWAAACGELKAWAICFGLGSALLWEPLAAAHWKPIVYVAIVWSSLLLFSRLVIWLTLGIGLLAFGLDIATATLGHQLWPSVYVIAPIAATIWAILIRGLLFLFSASRPSPPIAQPPPPRPVHELEDHNG